MTMVSSGKISIGGSEKDGTLNRSVNLEIGRQPEAKSELNETPLRSLAQKQTPETSISMSDFYGKPGGPPPVLIPSPLNSLEGSTVTLTMYNGAANATYNWAIDFDTYLVDNLSPADFTGAVSGSFTTNSLGTGTFTVQTKSDTLTEVTEYTWIRVFKPLFNVEVCNTIIAVSNVDIVIPPTYQLTASAASVSEGSSVTFILATQYVPSGTLVYFNISGVSTSDIASMSINGSPVTASLAAAFVVDLNQISTLTVTLAADNVQFENESITVQLVNGAASASVSIIDTTPTSLNWLAKNTPNSTFSLSPRDGFDQIGMTDGEIFNCNPFTFSQFQNSIYYLGSDGIGRNSIHKLSSSAASESFGVNLPVNNIYTCLAVESDAPGTNAWAIAGGVITADGIYQSCFSAVNRVDGSNVITGILNFGDFSYSHRVIDIKIDSSGNIFMLVNKWDIFGLGIILIKLSAAFQPLWCKSIIINTFYTLYTLPQKLVLNGDSAFVCGMHSNKPLILKFNGITSNTTSPSIAWIKMIQTLGTTEAVGPLYAMDSDSAGNVYAAGIVNSQSIITKFDSNGNVAWTRRYNSTSSYGPQRPTNVTVVGNEVLVYFGFLGTQSLGKLNPLVVRFDTSTGNESGPRTQLASSSSTFFNGVTNTSGNMILTESGSFILSYVVSYNSSTRKNFIFKLPTNDASIDKSKLYTIESDSFFFPTASFDTIDSVAAFMANINDLVVQDVNVSVQYNFDGGSSVTKTWVKTTI